MNYYDISKNPSYHTRKLWLDGEVGMQRFDSVKYPKLEKYEQVARGNYWTPEEISLMKDKADFKKATKPQKHMYTSNLLRQTTLDSFQSPFEIFAPVCSQPELKNLLLCWDFFESNIHSRAYSHIIKNVYPNPSEVFDGIHEVRSIVDMVSDIGLYYGALDDLNTKMKHGLTPDKKTHKRAIYMALQASYGLEAFRFNPSFKTSIGMMENQLFVGNGAEIVLILKDELLHTDWTADLLKYTVQEDDDMKRIAEECAEEVSELHHAVIKDEKNWAAYLFSEGVTTGLNERILCAAIDWDAAHYLPLIGVKYQGEKPKTNPVPWYTKHTKGEEKQTALQETESSEYLVGVMSDTFNLAALPDL